jgi:hypothetical protein
MRHLAETDCFGKGLCNKPVCKVPECKGLYVESLHNLLTGNVPSIHAVEYKEGEDNEEGFVNVAEEEYMCGRDAGWRTADD